MTSLVLRKVIGGGVLELKRIQIVCPACGQQVEAIATDGRVKGYCAVVKQYVDLLIETQREPDVEYRAKVSTSASMKKLWQDPEYRAKMGAIRKKRWSDPEYRAKMKAARARWHIG